MSPCTKVHAHYAMWSVKSTSDGLVMHVGESACGGSPPPVPLSWVLGSLPPGDAMHVYNALAQWADNERCGLEESSPVTESERRDRERAEAAVSAVEQVVERLEAEIVRAA